MKQVPAHSSTETDSRTFSICHSIVFAEVNVTRIIADGILFPILPTDQLHCFHVHLICLLPIASVLEFGMLRILRRYCNHLPKNAGQRAYVRRIKTTYRLVFLFIFIFGN